MSLLLVAALLGQQPAVATPATPATPEAPKLVCKRIVDTGSLVRGKKTCRTKAEWDRLAWAARLNGEDMSQRNAGAPPGSN